MPSFTEPRKVSMIGNVAPILSAPPAGWLPVAPEGDPPGPVGHLHAGVRRNLVLAALGPQDRGFVGRIADQDDDADDDGEREHCTRDSRSRPGTGFRDRGLEIMENWIQTGEQIDVVCANNDEMALGAIKALKDANLLDKVIVGGVDATPDALAAMKAGELEVTVFQDAKGQGGGGVDAAVKLARGETVPSLVDIPYQLVTPANMDQFIGAN